MIPSSQYRLCRIVELSLNSNRMARSKWMRRTRCSLYFDTNTLYQEDNNEKLDLTVFSIQPLCDDKSPMLIFGPTYWIQFFNGVVMKIRNSEFSELFRNFINKQNFPVAWSCLELQKSVGCNIIHSATLSTPCDSRIEREFTRQISL